MKRIKQNTRDQGILFSDHYVGDRLPEHDEVYLFEEIFNQLDISHITNSYSSEGGSMFSPRDQLAIILFALHKGISSSVKIADAVLYNMQFIYLAGGHVIKRRTISDFRQRHIKDISKLLISTVKLGFKSGLIDLNHSFSIDGSKFEANASFSKTRRKKEWKERQQVIIEHVDKLMQEWEENEKNEENYEEEKLERYNKIKERLKEIKEENEKKKKTEPKPDDSKKNKKNKESGSKKKESKAILKKNRVRVKDLESAEKHINEYQKIDKFLDEVEKYDDESLLNITDPDCRIMKSDSITKECYNLQAISSNQFIVALDVTQDENDQAQIEPMINQLEKNINLNKPIKFLADAGYNRGKNLEYLDKHEFLNPYISMYNRSENLESETEKYKNYNFTFDEDNEYWICPENNKLNFMKEFIIDGKKYTRFGCTLKECVFCENREQCLKTKNDIRRGYRTIDDDGYIVYRKEMKEKMQDDESKEIYSKRSSDVEPVFGQIKFNKGFKRFLLKRKDKVNGEALLYGVAHNIGKLMKNTVKNKEKTSCMA